MNGNPEPIKGLVCSFFSINDFNVCNRMVVFSIICEISEIKGLGLDFKVKIIHLKKIHI